MFSADIHIRFLRHRINLYYVWPLFLSVEIDPCRIKGSNYWRRRWVIDCDGINPY